MNVMMSGTGSDGSDDCSDGDGGSDGERIECDDVSGIEIIILINIQ